MAQSVVGNLNQVGDGDEVLDRTMRPRIHHGGDRVNAHSRKDVRPDAVRWSGVLQVEGEGADERRRPAWDPT